MSVEEDRPLATGRKVYHQVEEIHEDLGAQRLEESKVEARSLRSYDHHIVYRILTNSPDYAT